jgi:acyl-CoA synthetase (AMP-forming)/AMP-acid ligase II
MNIFGLLENSARRFLGKGAVYEGEQLFATYGELSNRSMALAAGMLSRANVGSRIAIASENRPEIIEILFAIWAAGMVAVPMNAKLHALEMTQILEDAGVSMLFASPKLAPALSSTYSATSHKNPSPVVIGDVSYRSLIETPVEQVAEVTPDTVAWLFYTSGTTGRSKGAMLTHRNLLAMALAHLADIDDVDENSSIIHAAPMSHGSGLYLLPYIARGARHVIPASSAYDPNEFLELCDAHPNCGAFLAPTMVQRLRSAVERANCTPPNLRNIIYGGGPMYVAELKQAMSIFGPKFSQIYGQGEAPMTITGMRKSDHCTDSLRVLGSVGYPRTGVEVRIVNANDEPVKPGETGEVICRGDVVMKGYWNNEKATSETLRGGWLHTGDVGVMDESGFLTLLDRSKDVVISGGTNIYPREVEEAILTHPAVSECCVIGKQDPEWGEIVVAFIVLVESDAVGTRELDTHCLDRIARFKRPKEYIFLESLPKNSSGKVLKRDLRELLVNASPAQ